MHNSEKPLAMYYFGKVNNNPNKDIFETQMQAGMMCINDVMIQGLNPDLPFGGVGYSGTGAYSGRDGFVNFSNAKAVMVKPTIDIDAINKLVMPPFTEGQKKQLTMMLNMPMYQSQVQKFMLLIGALFILGMAYKFGLLC